MTVKTKRILEALQLQPLTQEEMTARHILGRLYGPIATCVESTRNGRLYNKPLWEKALRDDVFLEKVATKALFLELGHPVDREETDMKQACACIPEVPRIVGDDLYAYVDILDTPNGRLLKTLVDYGFVPGISSRGSGDVMDNNQVDPETFFLDTWDIVQLPAVKKARLSVFESFDTNTAKLKKALVESYSAAKEEDKDTMKKALENLKIDIEEELSKKCTSEATEPKRVLTAEDIPWDPDAEDAEFLAEDAETEKAEETTEVTDETEESESTKDSEDITESEDAESDDAESIEAIESEETENTEETSDTETTPINVDVNSVGEGELDTVSDAVELLQKYDDNTKVEFKAIQIDGEEYPIDNISSAIENGEDEDTLVIGVTCGNAVEDTDTSDDELTVETIEEIEETEETDGSAEDTGDAEVIESLKALVRQKEAMETEISNLRKAKAVGDAKVEELQEKLTRYRTAFRDTSAEAAKIPELQSKIQKLTEKLTQSKTTITKLTEQVNNAQQLKESVASDRTKVKQLHEEVSQLTKKSNALEAKLEGQTKLYTEKLQERTNLAKTYKARFLETLNRYLESKASMLGVSPSEITSRLNENYTLADVDAVCDQILNSTVNFSRLPFGGRTKTSARIAESVSKPVRRDPEYGYEIDDSLLELAGLKK